LQMFLDRGDDRDWFSSGEFKIEALLAALGFVYFLVHTMTVRGTSFFNRRLALDRNFMAGCGFYFMLGAVLYATRALLPPLLQNLMGYSVLDAGLVTAPSGAGSMLAMMLAGKLVGRFKPRTMIAVGFSVSALSLWQMSQFTLDMDSHLIVASGFVQGLGLGLISVPLTTASFSTLDPALRGDGTAIYSLARNIGSSIGISFMQSELTRHLRVAHAQLAENVSLYNPLAAPWHIDTATGLALVDAEVNRQAGMVAYLHDFRIMLFMTIAVMPLLVLMKTAKRKAGEPPPDIAEH